MQEKLPFERVFESSINNRAKKFHFLKYFFRGEFSFILGGSGWKVFYFRGHRIPFSKI